MIPKDSCGASRAALCGVSYSADDAFSARFKIVPNVGRGVLVDGGRGPILRSDSVSSAAVRRTRN